VTEPRPHYALPPPLGEPPDERAAEVSLWGACPACGGLGKAYSDVDVDDAIPIPIPCPVCRGSGCSADLE
jgi:hypothetical protein